MFVSKEAVIIGIQVIYLALICSGLPPRTAGTWGEASGASPYGPTILRDELPPLTKYTRQSQGARGKRALLIGVSKYDRKRKGADSWGDLDTKNDLEALASILIHRFRFKPEDIRILSDSPVEIDGKVFASVSPTSKTIADTFRTFLIEQTKPGDIVFFYFAGHGSQVPDDGTEELDGLDETLVPSDYVTSQDHSKDIRDDELGGWLDELGRKEPTNVTVAIDSCHSGTATRGDYDVVRGGPWKGTPVPRAKVRGEDASLNDLSASQSGRALRNYVFFSAASSRQKAVQRQFCAAGGDCKTFGVFTNALAKAMDGAGRTTTYRDVYERILVEVARDNDQNPQIEGDQIDQVFLGDGALPAESYIAVEASKFNKNEFALSAGSLQGITLGSKFALHPPSTKSRGEGEPLAEATVVKVGATYSTLRADRDMTPEAVKSAARAFEIMHNYESVLKVVLKGEGNSAPLQEMLKKLGLATTVSEGDPSWNVLIRAVVQADQDEQIVPTAFRGVILQRRDGESIIARVEEGKEMPEKVRDALVSEAKRITLLSLDNPDPKLRVELRMIPVEVEWHPDVSGRAAIDKVIGDKKEGLRYSKRGNIEFKVNDWYRLEVRNLSDSDVYITILNLDANGRISPAFPRFNINNLIKRAGATVAPGQGWMPIEKLYIRVTEPVGLESLHAIGTREQTNFSPLFDPGIAARGKARGDSFTVELLREAEMSGTRRGDGDAAHRLETVIKSPLGQLFIAAQEGRGVRGPTASMPPPSWAKATISYVVVK